MSRKSFSSKKTSDIRGHFTSSRKESLRSSSIMASEIQEMNNQKGWKKCLKDCLKI